LPEHPSHADILAKIEQVAKDVGLLTMANQGVQRSLADISDRVGKAHQDERGDWIGTGMAGDLVRLRREVQDRFKLYDKFTYTLIGGATAVSVSILAFWWAVKPKIEALIHGAGGVQ